MKPTKLLIGSLLLAGSSLASGCATQTAMTATRDIPERSVSGWQGHFHYGRDLLETSQSATPRLAFSRSAFESAARFSIDYAPAYVGLGYTNMRLGEYGSAQQAFLEAGLLSDNAFYWALGALAALKNADEHTAYAFYLRMKSAQIQPSDDLSRFIDRVYAPQANGTDLSLVRVDEEIPASKVDADLVCEDGAGDDVCEHLNIVAEIFFVRRLSYTSQSVGNDFFSNLVFQLGAERIVSIEKDFPGPSEKSIADELSLSIPTIQYAIRALPLEDAENIYINATPSVLMTLGNESEVREGTDRTILYNSEGFSDDFTAETGTTLVMEADQATADYCRMKLEFEFNQLSTFTPGASAVVLDVATSRYSLKGYFPYNRPVVLGTMSNGVEEQAASGEAGLRNVPGIGNLTGNRASSIRKADTLILGRVSAPKVFEGSNEIRLLSVMKENGFKVDFKDGIHRRNIIYDAPEIDQILLEYLGNASSDLVR